MQPHTLLVSSEQHIRGATVKGLTFVCLIMNVKCHIFSVHTVFGPTAISAKLYYFRINIPIRNFKTSALMQSAASNLGQKLNGALCALLNSEIFTKSNTTILRY